MDIELDIAREQARGGTGERFIRELRDTYARQARALEARKNLTNTQKDKLRGLYSDLASAQSQLDAIAEEGERKLDEKRRRAAGRREREQERDRQRFAKIQEAAARTAERRGDLLGDLPGTRQGLRRAALRHVDDVRRGLRDREREQGKGITAADIRRMQVEFLNSLQGITNQFGSNIQDTHGWATVRLMYDQNRLLEGLTRSVSHPGARYARTELSGAYGGVGGI
jgi:hypothetical protein